MFNNLIYIYIYLYIFRVINYLISLNVRCELHFGQNFFNSIRFGVLRLFFEVVYRKIPFCFLGLSKFLHEHSSVIIIREPLFLLIVMHFSFMLIVEIISLFYTYNQEINEFFCVTIVFLQWIYYIGY